MGNRLRNRNNPFWKPAAVPFFFLSHAYLRICHLLSVTLVSMEKNAFPWFFWMATISRVARPVTQAECQHALLAPSRGCIILYMIYIYIYTLIAKHTKHYKNSSTHSQSTKKAYMSTQDILSYQLVWLQDHSSPSKHTQKLKDSSKH